MNANRHFVKFIHRQSKMREKYCSDLFPGTEKNSYQHYFPQFCDAFSAVLSYTS